MKRGANSAFDGTSIALNVAFPKAQDRRFRLDCQANSFNEVATIYEVAA